MAALSAAAVLPMVVLAFLAASRQQRREARQFEYDAIRLARAISDVEASLVERVRVLLVDLSHRPEVTDRPGPRCDSLVADLRRHYPQYANLGVVELDGSLSCSALPRRPRYAATREYFQRALSTRGFVIGSYQIGRQSGLPSVNFALPVLDDSGRPTRVVYASLALAAWSSVGTAVSSQIPVGATLIRVDRAGRILATAPQQDSSLVGRVLPIFGRIAADSGQSGLVRGRDSGGGPHLYAFARVHEGLRGEGIVVVLRTPEAVAYADARHTLRTNLVAIAVVGLGVLLLTWLLGGALIVRPLTAAAGAAERLASGDLRVRLGPPYDAGEIGRLARAFDAMAASIASRQDERDRARHGLERSERELRHLVDHARYGIFRMAPDGRFLDANRAMARVLGYASAEEIVRLGPAELGGDPTDLRRAVAVYEATGEEANVEVRWRGRDRKRIVLRTAGRAVRDDAGDVVCFEVFAEDITETRALEERYRTLSENSLSGIYLIDDGRLIYVNPAFARMFGYTTDELVGADLMTVIHPDDREIVRENVRRRLAGEVSSVQYEFRGLRKDGGTNRILALGASVDQGHKRIIFGNLLDVTERKLAEERFGRIFRDSPVPSLLTRMSDGQALEVNEAFLHLTERARGEVIGRTTADIGLYLDSSVREQLYARLRASGHCPSLHARVRTARGRERTLLVSATRVDLGGEPCAISFAHDITDLEEARSSALHSEEKFATVFRSSLTAMSLSELSDGRFIDVNDQYVKMLGFARSELVGKTSVEVGIFWQAADRARMVEALRGRSEVRDLELRLRTKDGRAVAVVSSLRVIETEGRMLLVAALLDLSAMRETEGALRVSEQRFRAAFMTGADAYVIVGRDDGLMVEVNERFEAMYGWRRDEVIGRTSLDLGVWADPSARERMLAMLRSEGRVRSLEVLGRRRDGTSFPVLYSVSELRGTDPPLLLGVIRDVTRERVLEDELRQAQKMEALGHLTGGIAHDFNNLLNVVLTNAALAREERGDPDAVAGYLADLETAAQQGGALVRNLLAFSRRERLTPVPIDLVETLRDLGRTLRRLLPETIEVRVDAGPDSIPVDADEGAFEQIILNLATNARDAMPKGGTLSLGVGEILCREGHDDHIALGLDAPGRYAVVTAADSGEGMDEATLTRAFHPFFTTKPLGAGTGLGLATVFGLMKQHGGMVRIDSVLGQGTTVRLYFPSGAGNPARMRGERTAAPAPRGAETILVVEDQELLRRAAARALTKMGYAVLEAGDGAEALQVLSERGKRVALVLSDLVMPVMGGVELHERLRAEGRQVRFLLMSGHTGSPDGGEPPAGVPVIRKPWTVEALAKRLRELLDAPPRGD